MPLCWRRSTATSATILNTGPGPIYPAQRPGAGTFGASPLPALLSALRRSDPVPRLGLPGGWRRSVRPSLLIRREAGTSCRVESLRPAPGCHLHRRPADCALPGAVLVLDPPVGLPLPVQVPVNLRRYLPGGRAGALCNLAGSIYPPSATIRSNVRGHVRRRCTQHTPPKEASPQLGQALALRRPWRCPTPSRNAWRPARCRVRRPARRTRSSRRHGCARSALGGLRRRAVGGCLRRRPGALPPRFFLALSSFGVC